jgi:hypothetical protein
VIGAGGFVPGIIFMSRFRRIDALPALYANPEFWSLLWKQAWESMALMILPFSAMLLVSLVTQIEDRSNGWKQLHAAPLPLPIIFAAKLIVVLGLTAGLLMVHIAGLYASALLPSLLLRSVPPPATAFPVAAFIWRSLQFLVDALPIVAIQYGLALRFRTFVAPLGVGLALWILSIGTISWSYNYLIPYSYAGLDYLAVEYHRRVPLPANPRVIAGACFCVCTAAAYAVYAARRDKG